MEKRTIVLRLRALRQEFGDGKVVIEMVAPVGLIVADVCDALELSEAERNLVLGEELSQAVREWETARMWIPVERETATSPVAELAAVPV